MGITVNLTQPFKIKRGSTVQINSYIANVNTVNRFSELLFDTTSKELVILRSNVSSNDPVTASLRIVNATHTHNQYYTAQGTTLTSHLTSTVNPHNDSLVNISGLQNLTATTMTPLAISNNLSEFSIDDRNQAKINLGIADSIYSKNAVYIDSTGKLPVLDASQLYNVTVSSASQYKGQMNYIINSEFQIWQRMNENTTLANDATGNLYIADCFTIKTNQTGVVVKRRFLEPSESENLSCRVSQCLQILTPATMGSAISLGTWIEDGFQFSNKPLVFSAWIRSPDYSGSLNLVDGCSIYSSDITVVTSSYTNPVNVSSTWNRVSFAFTAPTNNGNITEDTRMYFQFLTIPAGNPNKTIEIAAVQLELGTAVTNFENLPYDYTFALCQRYYSKYNIQGFDSSNNIISSNNPIESLIYQEFKVNTYTTSSQQTPMICALVDGGYIIAWKNVYNAESNANIYAQRYYSNDTKYGTEFLVNSTYATAYAVIDIINVSSLDNDGYIIFWNYKEATSGNTNFKIFYQKVDLNNNKIGQSFNIATIGCHASNNLTRTIFQNGLFYLSYGLYRGGIFTETYDLIGTKIGNTTTIATFGDAFVENSLQLILYNGCILNVFRLPESLNIRALITNNGVLVGTEFIISQNTTTVKFGYSGITLDDNGYVIVWNSSTQDSSNNGVYARRFNSNNEAIAGEFLVNTWVTDNQQDPNICKLSNGGYIITWVSYNQSSENEWGVYAKKYNSNNTLNGTEFRVNSYTTNIQGGSDIYLLSDGGYIVTWHSYTQDGSSYGIYAQRFNSDNSIKRDISVINTPNYGACYSAGMYRFQLPLRGFIKNSSRLKLEYNTNQIYTVSVNNNNYDKINTITMPVKTSSYVVLEATGESKILTQSFVQLLDINNTNPNIVLKYELTTTMA